MKKSKNYGARVEIDSLINGEVDNNSLFTLLTDLKIRDGVFDMRILLASRSSKCTGHEALAEKHLASRSTSIESPYEFPYDRTLSCAVGEMSLVYLLLGGCCRTLLGNSLAKT
ncbi:hypothetical protein TM074_01160 [Candidatus Nanosynbacter sp. TM7-074]|uniref:Uncharacterized protein n=1 Tax=Candidatus Nanosynbacter sp. TM7-074 TaxID=3158573 RepID=A0AB39JC33_9BACT